jgi:long-chain acyl-CoA synthetase
MSFVDVIAGRCAEAGSRPVLFEVRGQELLAESGRALAAKIASVRGFLRARGVQPGDRVALLGPNSATWAALDLAILSEGAICVPLYARQEPRELAGTLRDCTPKVLLADGDALASSIAAAWPERERIATYAQALAGAGVEAPPHALRDTDPVTIIYTSGTSGEPKGVLLNAGNIDFMLGVTVRELAKMRSRIAAKEMRPRIAQNQATGSDREERVFHYLPFCFAGSRIMLWSQLHRGNPLMMSTDLTQLQQELQTAAPHYCLNVPALLERIRNGVGQKLRDRGGPLYALYQRAVAAHQRASAGGGKLGAADTAALWLGRRVLFPRIKALIGKNLEFLACGSAMLNEDTQRWFEMLGIPVYQVYGLTESTAIITIDDTQQAVQPGRVGHAVPGCELKLSEHGELLCRGPNVFPGYWNRPDASAAVLRDGWLHTGDQAELDASGNVKIVGRVKEVLVPESGHNVAPAPLEQKLMAASDRLEQAVVFGHGRPFLTALVTGPLQGDELDRILEAVNAELPHYMRVRKLHRAHEAFTPENGLLTANQKLKRKAIEERYRDAIEAMYR